MPETERQRTTFRFEFFELNRRARELRKHGVKLKLQEQPAQILALLLERPGEVVTREEIRKRLWQEQTYVDFDNAINSAVRKLRDALGDSSENPRFVETLPRQGYRFIAPVSLADHAAEANRLMGSGELISAETGREIQVHPTIPPVDPKRRRTARWALGSVAIFLVLLIGAALWLLRLGSNHRAMPFSVSPLTAAWIGDPSVFLA